MISEDSGKIYFDWQFFGGEGLNQLLTCVRKTVRKFHRFSQLKCHPGFSNNHVVFLIMRQFILLSNDVIDHHGVYLTGLIPRHLNRPATQRNNMK